MRAFFSPAPIALPYGIAIVRIITGLLLVYHGREIFSAQLMAPYLEWEMFRGPLGSLLVYAGKSAEFIAGILLTLGLFTRIGACITIVTLLWITFFIGHGHFWYEDQHPFLFVLLAVVFMFTGPGAWSVDSRLFASAAENRST